VRRGLELLRAKGEEIILVLGHVHFYRRFGFGIEKTASLQTPFPPRAFMALELRSGALDAITGKVRYAKSFGL
jgi:predicted N-acetyltransferase YhbS